MTDNREVTTEVKTSRLYNWVAALLAFGVWGGWAFYVNLPAGLTVGLTSGVAQGTVSMVMTFVMIKAVTLIFRHLPNRLLQLTLPTILTVGAAAGFLIWVHSQVSTPNIFWTIFPSLSMAVPFCVYTSYKLIPQEQHTTH